MGDCFPQKSPINRTKNKLASGVLSCESIRRINSDRSWEVRENHDMYQVQVTSLCGLFNWIFLKPFRNRSHSSSPFYRSRSKWLKWLSTGHKSEKQKPDFLCLWEHALLKLNSWSANRAVCSMIVLELLLNCLFWF